MHLNDLHDLPTIRQLVSDLVSAIWQNGGPTRHTLESAERARRLLTSQLSAKSSPAEQLALLNILYSLEQGVGNRNDALMLAERIEPLAGMVGSAIDHVMAVFQLAKALLYVDRNADAVRWTEQGLVLGDQIVGDGSLADAESIRLRRLLVDQESRQINRMATLGGMNEKVDLAIQSVLARWAELDEPMVAATGLGMLVEARVFQGLWPDAVNFARDALTLAGYPAKKDPAIAYSLCFGALALCRSGQPDEAIPWTIAAQELSRQVGNHECVIESRAVHAVAMAATGETAAGLAEIDGVIDQSTPLNMAILTTWVIGLRGWIRMNAGLPTDPDELRSGCEHAIACGYNTMAAELRYASACAMRLAGRDSRDMLDLAIAEFERLGLAWHLAIARRGAMIG